MHKYFRFVSRVPVTLLLLSTGVAIAQNTDSGLTPDQMNESISTLMMWVKVLGAVLVLLLGIVAIQSSRISEASIFDGIDFDKLNARLFMAFCVIGLISATAATVKFSQFFLPPSASEHGVYIDNMFWISMALVTFAAVVTNAALFYFAFRYAHSEGRKALYYADNSKLEMIWTAVPAVVLTVLLSFGVNYWSKIMFQAPTDAYTVELNGEQFAWTIRYPGMDGQYGNTNVKLISATNMIGWDFSDKNSQDDFLSGDLVLPVGKPVVLKIRSRDVLHSVFLPHFRVKMDAVPGMPTKFVFTPTKTTAQMRQELSTHPNWTRLDAETGVPRYENFDYELACTEVCGRGHFSMRKVVKVVTEEEYIAWMKQQKAFYDPSTMLATIAPTTTPNSTFGNQQPTDTTTTTVLTH